MTRRPLQLCRRGIALLLVLATLLVATTAAAGLARLAVSSAVARDLDAHDRQASELRHAAELAILIWLQRESPRAVLPPEATEPRVEFADEAWTIGDRPLALRITAFDQFGMLPHTELAAGSPLRATLPADVLRVAEAWQDAPRPIGLDMLARNDAGMTIFPRLSEPPGGPALGALVATHNPLPGRRGGRDPGAVNVNTAPIDLVERAMRLAGIDAIDAVLAARRRGEPARVPGGSRTRDGVNPRLTHVSSAWSFRVDCSVENLTQSWWLVYVHDGSNWTLVQRLAITD